MANPYHDFTAAPIAKHGYEALNEGMGGLGDTLAAYFQKQKDQEMAVKNYIMQKELDSKYSQQNEAAKQQAEFDMEGKRMDRYRKMNPVIGDPINEQANFNPLRGTQGVVSSSISGQPMPPMDTASSVMGGQFNPVQSSQIPARIDEMDPMTGKVSRITNPAYERHEKPPTAAQETTALYASRIKQANAIFDKLEKFTHNQDGLDYVQAGLPNFLNAFKGGDMQSYQQAQKNFLNAVLRRESGAVISPTEFAEGRQQYFPLPGDGPEVLAQKKANRDLVMKTFIRSSRQAYVPYEETSIAPNAGSSNYVKTGTLPDGRRVGVTADGKTEIIGGQ